jgi:metal iron transporter
MCIIISKVNVDWGDAFFGFVPSKTIFQQGGLYTGVKASTDMSVA